MSSTPDTQETNDTMPGQSEVEYDPKRIRLSLGAQLADARKRMGLTQMQLSAATGVDQAVISRIERGRANPTVTLLQTVIGPLGLQVSLAPRRKDFADGDGEIDA